MKRIIALLLVGLLAVCAIASTVTYPSRSAGSGLMVRKVVWNFNADDYGDRTLTSGPVYGHAQRIVIEATGTDTSWGVQLKDEHGVSLFSKSDLTSVSVPYSYPLTMAAADGNDYLGIPVCGPLTVLTTNVAYTTEIQTLTSANATDGTFTLTYGGQTTAAIDYDESLANIKTALETLSTVAVDDITVGGTTLDATGTTTFTFAAALGNVPLLTIGTTLLGLTEELQTLTIDASATAGTWTLTYGGETTAAMNHDISTANVKVALEALDGIAVDDIAVGGTTLDAGGPMTFTFRAKLGNVGAVTTNTTGLTGPTISGIAETTPGALVTGVIATTTEFGALLTDITATVYYVTNGN